MQRDPNRNGPREASRRQPATRDRASTALRAVTLLELLARPAPAGVVAAELLALGKASKVDPLAQVVHVVQVLAPPLVDDLQQEEALEFAHQLLAELVLPAVVERQRLLLQAQHQVVAIDALGIDARELLAR